MAAIVHAVLDTLVVCSVNDTVLSQGHTSAARLATDIFIDTYKSMKDKMCTELDAYFESYSD